MRAAVHALFLIVAACDGEAANPDGMWTVTTISGQEVPPGKFLLRVRDGRVTGGRDGCNSWGFDATRAPAPDGTRMIISDAQECSPTPQLRGYWRALGNGNAPLRTTEGGELRIRAGGDEIIARPVPD
jgi:hypothetical protein